MQANCKKVVSRLGIRSLDFYAGFVLLVLRFIGIVNAAIWLGAAVFFTFGIAPAVFSPEMKRVFGDYYVGIVAQHLIERYFALHAICGVIALIHLFAETFYTGRPLRRSTLLVVGIALAIGVLGGIVLQPKLKSLHRIKYSQNVPEEERAAASRHFRWLHGISSLGNVVAMFLLIGYTWRVTHPPESPRFTSTHKFRG